IGPSKGRILVLRIVRETTAIAVRANGAHNTCPAPSGQRMTRSSSTAACWAVACLAAMAGQLCCQAVEPSGTTTMPVRGEMVDADTPAAYRLPVIGIFAPPTDRLAMRSDAVKQAAGIPRIASDVCASAGIAARSPAGLAYAARSELTNQLLPAVQRGYNL